MLTRARILKAPRESAPSVEPPPGEAGIPRARILRRELAEAHTRALAVRKRALEEVAQLRVDAELELEGVRRQASEAGYREGLARAAAHAIKLTQLEADADVRGVERAMSMARLLAERLLGKALELEPALVVDLARQALGEVRGAHHARLSVSPGDAKFLERALEDLSVGPLAVELRVREDLVPGQFQLDSDAGSLNTDLGSRLDLLCSELRECFKE